MKITLNVTGFNLLIEILRLAKWLKYNTQEFVLERNMSHQQRYIQLEVKYGRWLSKKIKIKSKQEYSTRKTSSQN